MFFAIRKIKEVLTSARSDNIKKIVHMVGRRGSKTYPIINKQFYKRVKNRISDVNKNVYIL